MLKKPVAGSLDANWSFFALEARALVLGTDSERRGVRGVIQGREDLSGSRDHGFKRGPNRSRV